MKHRVALEEGEDEEAGYESERGNLGRKATRGRRRARKGRERKGGGEGGEKGEGGGRGRSLTMSAQEGGVVYLAVALLRRSHRRYFGEEAAGDAGKGSLEDRNVAGGLCSIGLRGHSVLLPCWGSLDAQPT